MNGEEVENMDVDMVVVEDDERSTPVPVPGREEEEEEETVFMLVMGVGTALVLNGEAVAENAKDGEPSELSWLNVEELNALIVDVLIEESEWLLLLLLALLLFVRLLRLLRLLRLGDVDEVTFVFGRANAAAIVLESDELPGRESAIPGAFVVNDVRRDVGVGVGS